MKPPAALKSLSSAQTFFTKVLFPLFWIPTFGVSTAGLWLGALRDKHGAPAPEPMKLIFLAVWICGSVFLYRMCGKLKRVRTDGKLLYISNYLREIAVPVKKIADVTESRWIRGRPVTICFEEDTEFGESVTFLPPMRLYALGSPHPVVAELKEMAGLG